MDQLNAYAYEGAKMVFGPLGDGETLAQDVWSCRRLCFRDFSHGDDHPDLFTLGSAFIIGAFCKKSWRRWPG